MYGFEYLKSFLEDEGFKIEEEDDRFTFKYKSTYYTAFKNEKPFLQIAVMCNTDGFDRKTLLEVCNELNQDKFVTKCSVLDHGCSVSYECIPNDATTSQEFMSMVRILDAVSDQLFERLSNNK